MEKPQDTQRVCINCKDWPGQHHQERALCSLHKITTPRLWVCPQFEAKSE